MTVAVAHADRGVFSWWRAGTPDAKRALVAASLGWMLDSFDVMLYALVLASLMRDLSLDAPTAGLLGSVTLLASAAGGLVFGVIADRFGRTRALMGSIIIYSLFTAACGFAQTVWQLAVFRVMVGLGMGGEWASGAALVSETWSAEHRGKALGFMQSSWAIGYGAAAIVTAIVIPIWGWRGVFFVGVLPAFFTIWVRRRVKEPEMWERQCAVTAELYPTAIRATAQGFTYNIGRVASAAAPFVVGSLAQSRGFSAALSICSVAFLLAAVFWIWIPETRGRALE